MPKKRLFPIYLGIFLISAATLMFEVSLTRIFSVIQWYHFAFMVISIALLGFGVAGTFLAISKVMKKEIDKLLFIFSLLFSVFVIFSFLVINQIPFDIYKVAWDRLQILYISLYYIVLAIPFFCAGCIVPIAMTKLTKDVNKIYFSDLFGAGIGSLSVVLLFGLFNVNIIFLSSGLAALAGLLFLSINPKINKKIILVPALLIIILFLSLFLIKLNVAVSPYKSLSRTLNYPDAKILDTGWNSLARIDLVESSALRYAPGISYKYTGTLPKQLAITVDGDSLNAISYGNLGFIDFLPSSLAYKISSGKDALIIQPGGGPDILAAKFYKKSATITETNKIIVDLVKEYGVYEDIDVNVIEGRSFIKKTDKKFDIIQLSLAGHPIASSTGLYGLN